MENYGRQLTKQERRELRREEEAREQKQRRLKHFRRRIALWTIAAVFIAGAVFGIIMLVQTPAGDDIPVSVAARTENDWVKGNKESDVILIEYSDFQCPACASYHPLVKRLVQEFGNDVQFVYRHFPLGRFPHSRLAGQAAEAAGRQGKFWEMHDMIFANQKEWSGQRGGKAEETFITYAGRLDLNIEQFKDDLHSKSAENKVESDRISGIRARVNSTPTFFLNGKKIQNPRSYEEFRNIISQALP
jgi:protein-disulfide isomerase